ncbi:MAG: OmpA family protein [Bradymonadia bacterium]
MAVDPRRGPTHLGVLSLVMAAVFSLAPDARGQEPYDLDISNFRPAMDSKGLITVERSKALGTFEPSIGLFLDYAFGPLQQQIGGDTYELVESFGTGRFVLALGLFRNYVEIGASLPVVIVRGDADGPGDEGQLSGDGLGEAQVALKLKILDRDTAGIGVALIPVIYLPTGEADIFASHAGTQIAPRLAFDWMLGQRVSMAVNLGARLRERRAIDQPVTITDDTGAARTVARDDPFIVGNEATYSAGIGFSLLPNRLDFIIEGYGGVPLESDAERAMPLEALAAFKLFLVNNSYLSIGATRGLLDSYGDPNPVRVFAGIVFEPGIGDRDGDGLPDDVDQCPDQPEDKDGWQDEDGCPDPDNDGDGILDVVDLCPNEKEDFNGFEDKDGCPDGRRDRDGDGIEDSVDKCPDQPEDKDGFQDEDGCPDPDNDGDGILDTVDQCPMEAEDLDGWQDEDGCPDPDNDGDGILDNVDRCPNKPENFNGIDDEDGCPEPPKKVVITGGKLNILEKVYFETNKAVIRPESYDILSQVAESLRQNPEITLIEIQGHTDSRGRDSYNMRLSKERAAAVLDFLVSREGIDASRLTSQGYGETQPIDTAENREAWAKNRRVEFVIKEGPADLIEQQDNGPPPGLE